MREVEISGCTTVCDGLGRTGAPNVFMGWVACSRSWNEGEVIGAGAGAGAGGLNGADEFKV